MAQVRNDSSNGLDGSPQDDEQAPAFSDRKAFVTEGARAYLKWFEGLARILTPRQSVVSRYYRSQRLTAYSRYSKFKLAVQGAPSICIADIAVVQPGHGFFAALCDQFESPDCPVHAQALFVENVANRRFVAWLGRRGFVPDPPGDPQFPSLYLLRMSAGDRR